MQGIKCAHRIWHLSENSQGTEHQLLTHLGSLKHPLAIPIFVDAAPPAHAN